MTEDRIILRVLSGAWLEGAADGLRVTARKKLALLAYLALDRGSAPRDLLAGLIWGDVPDDKAKASLRQALSELRSAHPVLKAALAVDRTTVSLSPGHVLVETDLILADLAEGRLPASLRGGGETMNDILYGFESIGERFAEWVADVRKNCSDRILAGLSEAASREDLPATTRMELAEAALTFEPLGERQCRFAMSLANGFGDIGKALQIYASFYARMEAELDMEPSLTTQDLAVQIKMSNQEPSIASVAQPSQRLQHLERMRDHGKPVLAILPFSAAGPEPIDDYLAEMLVDNMVMRITRSRDISVISRVSIRHLADRPDVAQVLKDQMGVGYLITGHILRHGDTFVLNVELSNTADGHTLWAERYQANVIDLTDAQSRIADEVINRILPNLHVAELNNARLINLEQLNAYQKLLRAQELVYTLSRTKFDEAGQQLRALVETQSDFAPAQVALADWHSLAVGQGWSPDAQVELATIERLLNEALDSDRRNGRALAMLGHNTAIYMRQNSAAMVLFDEALAASPGDAETLLWTGPALAFSGQQEVAIERLEHARALNYDNPLGFRYDHFLAIAYFAADRMDDAARVGIASFVRNSRYVSNLRVTTAACAAIGDQKQARELATRTLALEPDFRVSRLVATHPFRDPAKRAQYGALLAQAGLPN